MKRCGEGDGQCDFVVVFHGAQDVQRGGFAGAGCAEETAWPFLQPVLFPGEPDIDSIADPAERKRRILLKQFYVSGIIGTFRAALSKVMTTPTEIGHFVSEELLPASRRICKCHRNRKQRSSQRHHRKPSSEVNPQLAARETGRAAQYANPASFYRVARKKKRGKGEDDAAVRLCGVFLADLGEHFGLELLAPGVVKRLQNTASCRCHDTSP